MKVRELMDALSKMPPDGDVEMETHTGGGPGASFERSGEVWSVWQDDSKVVFVSARQIWQLGHRAPPA